MLSALTFKVAFSKFDILKKPQIFLNTDTVKEVIMKKSLRIQLIAIFIALGIAISLAVSITMYLQYTRYILYSTRTNLTNTANFINTNYPELKDLKKLLDEGLAGSQYYNDLLNKMDELADSFQFTYIYVIEKRPDGLYFIFDTGNLEDDLEDNTFNQKYAEVPDSLQKAFNNKSISITEKPYSDQWGTFLSSYIPVIQRDSVIGMICIDFDISPINELQNDTRISIGIQLIFAVIFSAVIAFFVSRSFIKPIAMAQKAAMTLAEMDLSINIESKRQDEIGEMIRALMKIRDNFAKNISNIEIRLNELSDLSKTLDTSMDESVSNMNIVFQGMDLVQTQSGKQSDSVEQSSQAVNVILDNITSLNSSIDAQAEHINQSSSAIEEMVGNIRSIRSVVNKANSTAHELNESSEQGQGKIILLQEKLKTVTALSASLLEANKIIDNIANQTNILAMNAAIEAAHAGEAGKGFAVVASEIRKLAESVSKESASISKEINEIQRAIEGIVQVSDEAAQSFNAIHDGIKDIDTTFTTVNYAVEEQDTGGKQILDALKGMQTATQEVQTGAEEMQQGSQSIIKDIVQLKDASGEVHSSVQNIRQASQEIETSLAKAKDVAAKTLEHLEFTKKVFNIN